MNMPRCMVRDFEFQGTVYFYRELDIEHFEELLERVSNTDSGDQELITSLAPWAVTKCLCSQDGTLINPSVAEIATASPTFMFTLTKSLLEHFHELMAIFGEGDDEEEEDDADPLEQILEEEPEEAVFGLQSVEQPLRSATGS